MHLRVNYGIRLGIIGSYDPIIVLNDIDKLIKQNKWQSIDYLTGNVTPLSIYTSYICIPDQEYNHLLVYMDNTEETKKELSKARKNNIPCYLMNQEINTGFIERIVVENIKTYIPQSNDYTVYVGRGNYACNFNPRIGNPFTIEEYGRSIAIQKYNEWITSDKLIHLVNHLRTIRDKRIVLLCWCKPLPCHADTIKTILTKLGV